MTEIKKKRRIGEAWGRGPEEGYREEAGGRRRRRRRAKVIQFYFKLKKKLCNFIKENIGERQIIVVLRILNSIGCTCKRASKEFHINSQH